MFASLLPEQAQIGTAGVHLQLAGLSPAPESLALENQRAKLPLVLDICDKIEILNQEQLARGRELTYQGTNRAVHRFFRLVEDVSWNRGINKVLHRFIAEVIAVVAEDIVGFRSVAWANLQQEVLKELLGNMCDPEIFYPDRGTVWCSSRATLLDTSTEVILFAINYHTCMPAMIGSSISIAKVVNCVI